MDVSNEELGIMKAALASRHPKAHTKPKNFIRTYDEPENVAKYDAMVAKGLLVKEPVPGHVYRVTDLGKQVVKESQNG